MFKRVITYAKDFGLVGELVIFLVSGIIGLALPYCRAYLPFLNKTISLTVPIYIPLAFLIVFAAGGVMTRRFFGVQQGCTQNYLAFIVALATSPIFPT